jgi:hypothetical protein
MLPDVGTAEFGTTLFLPLREGPEST